MSLFYLGVVIGGLSTRKREATDSEGNNHITMNRYFEVLYSFCFYFILDAPVAKVTKSSDPNYPAEVFFQANKRTRL